MSTQCTTVSLSRVGVHTGPTAEDLDRIPAALKARPQWVLSRLEEVVTKTTGEVKLTKIPYNPHTLCKADTTDPATWGTFEQCLEALKKALNQWMRQAPHTYRGAGLGFVLTAEDPYLLVDMDHSVEPETDAIADWARTIVHTLDSYTQRSISRHGLHTLVEGTVPLGGSQHGDLQIWDHARSCMMTGWHLPETPLTIEARQSQLTMVHAAHILKPKVESKTAKQQAKRAQRLTPTGSPWLSDNEILAKARQAQNRDKFTRLWSGDWSGYDSQSEADEALCCLLAFYTRDPEQLDSLFRQSGLYREDKWSERDDYRERTIQAALEHVTEQYSPKHRSNGTRPKGKHKVRQQSVGEQPDSAPQVEDTPPEDTDENAPASQDELPYSDAYNGYRLVADHRQDLRYCATWGKWLTWTGTHWAIDDTGEPMRRARATVEAMVSDAQAAIRQATAQWMDAFQAAGGDIHADSPALKTAKTARSEAEKSFKHAVHSLQDSRLNAMLHQAESMRPLPVTPAQLDMHPWLLNCAHDVLNLKTGDRQPHTRDLLLTQWTDVLYDPNATCPTWDAFLDRIMAGNTNLIGFLQRAVGYALTGIIREHVLFILWGNGRNGKSTFLNTILALLGPYGAMAPPETFLESKGERHPTEKTMLYGKRFVASIETKQGSHLNESFIKQATGGDPITARRIREDFWTFLPTHKVFLATNHKPIIRGTDEAIWERPKLIPFTVKIPKAERQLDLPDRLKQELPGILAWAVRGCLAWQQDGLGEPEEVQQATEAYRAEMDTLGQFFTDCCVVGNEQFKTTTADLFEAYIRWCTANNIRNALDKNQLSMQLSERGFTPTRIGHRQERGWKGIGLLTPPRDEPDDDREHTTSGKRRHCRHHADAYADTLSAPESRANTNAQTMQTHADTENPVNAKAQNGTLTGGLSGNPCLRLSAMSAIEGGSNTNNALGADTIPQTPMQTQTLLTDVPPAHTCPQCDVELMDCLTYRKCPLCGWKDGPTPTELLEYTASDPEGAEAF